LHGILDYTARLNIPLVAITRQVNSQLGRLAKHVLLLPPAEPACPLRLAPTTITTMMLGLGDALAVNLLQKRGFTPQNFKGFHPGGQLGKQLMSVTELMHSGEDIPIVSPKDIMQDVILEITKKRLGCTAVVENNQLVGVITDGDLRRNISPDMLGKTAEIIMHKNPLKLPSSALAVEAITFMNRSQITTVFIVDSNQTLCGILHMHDCLRAGLNKEE
jgi:arabinose-5-phosphate isomerase